MVTYLTIDEVKNIIQEGETSSIEFKSELPEGWKKDPKKMFKSFFSLSNMASIEGKAFLFFGIDENKDYDQQLGLSEKSDIYNKFEDLANIKNFFRSKKIDDSNKEAIENIISQELIEINKYKLPNGNYLICLKFSSPDKPLTFDGKYWIRKMTSIEEVSLDEILNLRNTKHLLHIANKYFSDNKNMQYAKFFFYKLFESPHKNAFLCYNSMHDKHKEIFPILKSIFEDLKSQNNIKEKFNKEMNCLDDLFDKLNNNYFFSTDFIRQDEKIEHYIDVSINIRDIFINSLDIKELLSICKYDFNNQSVYDEDFIKYTDPRKYSPSRIFSSIKLKEHTSNGFCKMIHELFLSAWYIRYEWKELYVQYLKKNNFSNKDIFQIRSFCYPLGTNRELCYFIHLNQGFNKKIKDFFNCYNPVLRDLNILVYNDKILDNCTNPEDSYIFCKNGFVLNYDFVVSVYKSISWENFIRRIGEKEEEIPSNSTFDYSDMIANKANNFDEYYKDYTYFLSYKKVNIWV